ncbi:ubiquitin carboxyl-terminal hydrolase 42-like [Mytilus trossulus]|uniref:ubiquitin carboxyl-terminal hydrolase 42-like n=1 Tax=Mytilus trossulus TaxID=6551 RepID=UPI0030067A27
MTGCTRIEPRQIDINTEYQHINRKRKLQFATGTKSAKEIKISCVYPSGGLLNSKGANICFANALLQCVRLTDMHRILQLHDNCSDDRCFTCNFKEFIEEGPATAAPLIRQLNTVWHEYRFGKQQDAHEFFVKLMQEVWSTCIDTNQDCGVRNIFYGIQKSTVVCDTCGSVSSKEDVYSDISISIEEVQTVSQAVEEYFAAVPVEYNCLVCKSKNGSAKKMTTLDSIPKNIVIHLKR